MQAKDLMTVDVVTVSPDTPVREIAKVLLDHTISAVPVVDSFYAPVGMVSEGDLIGQDEARRDARDDWWLALLAEGEKVNPDFLASLATHREVARHIMAAPVVTVTEDTEASEIARLLAAYRIKRVPVVREGRIVGIVSRADLLRALVSEPTGQIASTPASRLSRVIDRIDQHFLHPQHPSSESGANKPADAHGDDKLNAVDFRGLVADFMHHKSEHDEEEHRRAVKRLKTRMKDLVNHHVEDESWQALLRRAREAAEHGHKEFLLLQFPSELCSDGGRAVNMPDPEWPATLRGEAAEIFLRWAHDLKPHGFHLTARVLNFPGGIPGDIGLFLVWGE